MSIPREEFDANFLRVSRRMASALVAGMAETGLSFAEMDLRLGRKPGFCLKTINRLLTGKQNSLDQISDVAWSMGCVLKPTITLLPDPAPDPQNPGAAA